MPNYHKKEISRNFSPEPSLFGNPLATERLQKSA